MPSSTRKAFRLTRLRVALAALALLLGVLALTSTNLLPAGAAAASDSGPGSGGSTPTPTPSPTPGATPSPTPTPGATPSPSPTPGATPSPTPFVTPSEIEADLAGAAIGGIVPRGEAEVEVEAEGREFRVRVENVNLPAGTSLQVFVDGIQIGNIPVAASLQRSELRLKTENGQAVPQVNARTRVVVADAAGNTVVAGSFSTNVPGVGPAPMPTPNPSTGEVRIESRLAGAAINGLTPSGHARFRSRADGQRDLSVEVEKVNLPAGTGLQVFIDGVKVADIVLSSALENEVELETERGQAVPNVTTASTVVVADSQGRTVLSGVFNTTAGLPASASNDIDDSLFFVEQQYRDFLSREADDSGLNFWRDQIAKCTPQPACIDGQRNNTSGAFFRSIEFQETGYLLYRLQKASTGEMPRRNAFLVDMQALARGVVVGQTGWEQLLEQNKQALIQAWVARAEFQSRFGSLTDEQYVDALLLNAGLAHNAELRNALVAGLSAGTQTRASVLRAVADSEELKQREKNPAFVLMQYFGYLHRDPDAPGFQFWLKKLDDNGGDFHKAEMVRSFLVSGEYRERFDWQ